MLELERAEEMLRDVLKKVCHQSSIRMFNAASKAWAMSAIQRLRASEANVLTRKRTTAWVAPSVLLNPI
jgi:hypothetical protein